MSIEIREALPGEYAEAGRVTADAYREFVRGRDDEGWAEYLVHIADVAERAHRTSIYVAVEDGQILGTATLELSTRVDPDDPTLDPEQAHIRMVGVHPDARRRGIARSLFDVCFATARAQGKTFITLHTTERMAVAQRMYEQMGFRRLDDRHFPDGFVLLTYRKDL